ncbi:MAG: hypothetical protein ACOC92_02075 [bacterium]
MDLTLLDLKEQLRAIGRGVVFISVDAAYDPQDPLTVADTKKWSPGSAINLAHLGDTEGPIEPEVEEEFQNLTLQELTGPASHKRTVSGSQIALTVPLFAADPRLRAILSPTGSASMGFERSRPVKEHTIVVFPEELFYDPDSNEFKTLSYTDADGWQLDGSALSSDQEDLLGMAVWFWRGSWERALPAFTWEDVGKSVTEVMFNSMQDTDFPDGHQVATIGDPADASIDLDPAA